MNPIGDNGMKKIIASKYVMLSCLFASTVLFAASLLLLGVILFGEVQGKWTAVLFFGISTGIAWICLWYCNRAACIVWVEDGMVKRKGLFWGFYKEHPVCAIQTVKELYVYKEGRFLFLVTDLISSDQRFIRARKDSYISVRKNQQNLKWLSAFWSGKIEK